MDQTTRDEILADQERIIGFYQADAIRSVHEQFKLIGQICVNKRHVGEVAQKIHDAFVGGVVLSPAQIIAILDHDLFGERVGEVTT